MLEKREGGESTYVYYTTLVYNMVFNKSLAHVNTHMMGVVPPINLEIIRVV